VLKQQPDDGVSNTVRLWSLNEDVLVEADPESESLVAVTRWGEFSIGDAGALVRESLRRMSMGPVSLRNVTGTWPPLRPDLATDRLGAILELLSGSVVHSLGSDDRQAPLLSAVPVVADAEFVLPPLQTAWPVRLSRFAALRAERGGLVLDSPCAPYRVLLHEELAIRVVTSMAAVSSVADLAAAVGRPAPVVADIVAFLAASAVVVASEGGPEFAEDVDPAMRLWSHHELLFHARSRSRQAGGSDDAEGEQTTPAPVVRPVPSGRQYALYRPELVEGGAGDRTLAALLEDDHRRPLLSRQELTARDIGELLYRSARIRSVGPGHLRGGADHDASQRPYFNMGGLYELELYLSLQRCSGLPNAIYHYDPQQHVLTLINEDAADRGTLLDMAKVAAGGVSRPAALLTVTARMGRVSWVFGGAAYATVLMHVGALQQTLYLTAKAMGLAAHAVAIDANRSVERVLGLDWPAEIGVGECVLDSPASEG
jgi:SagB-type dehydrogenase family enzyme